MFNREPPFGSNTGNPFMPPEGRRPDVATLLASLPLTFWGRDLLALVVGRPARRCCAILEGRACASKRNFAPRCRRARS